MQNMNEAESAFQLASSGRCSSDSSQHHRGSRFPRCCCPRMEQPTVIRYVIAVTVDIQEAFEDVLVCHVILMAQFLLSTSTVLY